MGDEEAGRKTLNELTALQDDMNKAGEHIRRALKILGGRSGEAAKAVDEGIFFGGGEHSAAIASANKTGMRWRGAEEALRVAELERQAVEAQLNKSRNAAEDGLAVRRSRATRSGSRI